MKKVQISNQIRTLLYLSVALIVVRLAFSESYSLMYMLWNIFLGCLPFIISSILLWHARIKNMHTALFVIGSIIWLALLPNAPYIVTDLIHIGRGQSIVVFYDTLLLFSCAWLGMVLFLSSMRHMNEVLMMRYSKKIASISLIIIMLLTSFGIYLGRFLRFNSWDIVARPFHFLSNIGNIFTHPSYHIDAYLFTAFFFFFLCMSYEAWKGTETV